MRSYGDSRDIYRGLEALLETGFVKVSDIQPDTRDKIIEGLEYYPDIVGLFIKHGLISLTLQLKQKTVALLKGLSGKFYLEKFLDMVSNGLMTREDLPTGPAAVLASLDGTEDNILFSKAVALGVLKREQIDKKRLLRWESMVLQGDFGYVEMLGKAAKRGVVQREDFSAKQINDWVSSYRNHTDVRDRMRRVDEFQILIKAGLLTAEDIPDEVLWMSVHDLIDMDSPARLEGDDLSGILAFFSGRLLGQTILPDLEEMFQNFDSLEALPEKKRSIAFIYFQQPGKTSIPFELKKNMGTLFKTLSDQELTLKNVKDLVRKAERRNPLTMRNWLRQMLLTGDFFKI
jgi:hypothetical protein